MRINKKPSGVGASIQRVTHSLTARRHKWIGRITLLLLHFKLRLNNPAQPGRGQRLGDAGLFSTACCDWQQRTHNLFWCSLDGVRPRVSLSAPESFSEPRWGVRGGVRHEGSSPPLIRAADQRIMGINNVLASSPNERRNEILVGASPGRGTPTTPTDIIAALQSRGSGHFDNNNKSFINCPHHPLHLLGHLVAAQMVVEGTVGPVAAVVGDRIGPLSVHFGYHGLLLFL